MHKKLGTIALERTLASDPAAWDMPAPDLVKLIKRKHGHKITLSGVYNAKTRLRKEKAQKSEAKNGASENGAHANQHALALLLACKADMKLASTMLKESCTTLASLDAQGFTVVPKE